MSPRDIHVPGGVFKKGGACGDKAVSNKLERALGST